MYLLIRICVRIHTVLHRPILKFLQVFILKLIQLLVLHGHSVRDGLPCLCRHFGHFLLKGSYFGRVMLGVILSDVDGWESLRSLTMERDPSRDGAKGQPLHNDINPGSVAAAAKVAS